MAKARAIVKRRRAVQNIRKITQTMQLIATARFQKCLQRATGSQPYTRKIIELVQTLAAERVADHPLLKPNQAQGRSILLVITSNRGLCGAYNAAVLRRMLELRQELAQAGLTPDLEVVGKKGLSYLRFLNLPVSAKVTDVEDRIAFDRVSQMAERYIDRYLQNQVVRVDIVYTQFHSVGVQRAAAVQLLPIQPPSPEPARPTVPPTRPRIQYEFSPQPHVLLARLVPEAVKIRLFQCFNDAIVSEQVARMIAMKAATEAAGDMVKFLTRQYNRARQTQITMELADIVGGANAVR